MIAIPFEWYLTQIHFENWNNVSDYQKDFWVVKQEKAHYNVAILGTSRAFHTVNPKVIMDQNPSSKVINFGTDGTSHADHYLFLYQLLQNGVQIDTLLLEVDEFTLSGWLTNTVPFKDYVFALKFNEDTFSQAYRDYFDRKKYYIWKLPLLRYIEYNTHYTLNPMKEKKSERFKDNFGFVPAFPEYFSINYNKDSLLLKTHPFDIQYLKKILDLGKSADIEIVVFTAPVHEDFIKLERKRVESIDLIRSIAKSKNVKYVDCSMVDGLRDTTYFSDFTHLNLKGANKFTKFLYNRINGK